MLEWLFSYFFSAARRRPWTAFDKWVRFTVLKKMFTSGPNFSTCLNPSTVVYPWTAKRTQFTIFLWHAITMDPYTNINNIPDCVVLVGRGSRFETNFFFPSLHLKRYPLQRRRGLFIESPLENVLVTRVPLFGSGFSSFPRYTDKAAKITITCLRIAASGRARVEWQFNWKLV